MRRGPSHSLGENTPSVTQKSRRGDASGIAAWKWQPQGPSLNPGGRPKVDIAAELAREVFEENFPAIKSAFAKVLRKGSPYAFPVLSDRAFGKLREVHQIEHAPLKDLSDAELEAKLEALKEQFAKEFGYIKADEPKVLAPAEDDPPKVQ